MTTRLLSGIGVLAAVVESGVFASQTVSARRPIELELTTSNGKNVRVARSRVPWRAADGDVRRKRTYRIH